MAVLGDVDVSGGDEAACGGACGFHERAPRVGVWWLDSSGRACDGSGGFGGADGLVAAALAKEVEDGLFELLILSGGFVRAAGIRAEFDVVPIALPLLSPGDGAAAGGAGPGGVFR